MYTRSYFSEDKKIEIPENYDGTAFAEKDIVSNEQGKENISIAEKIEERDTEEAMAKSSKIPFYSALKRLPLKNVLNLLPFSFLGTDKDHGNVRVFGTEEILISAVALYLFFSRDGDVECAIMLIILLFIR